MLFQVCIWVDKIGNDKHIFICFIDRFSEVFIWLRVNVKEENIILYRVGFIRKWLQTPDLNLVIAVVLESQSFFFYLKKKVDAVEPFSFIPCRILLSYYFLFRLECFVKSQMTSESKQHVSKGLWPGFPRCQFYRNTGMCNKGKPKRLSDNCLIGLVRPSVQTKWPVPAQRNYPTVTSLPSDCCVTVELLH